jgi:hypothetical protein
MGAIRANDFPRQADESGRAGDDHASMQTDPDDAERAIQVSTDQEADACPGGVVTRQSFAAPL